VPRFEEVPSSNPFGRRKTPDRVIAAGRIREALGWTPRHVDFRSGFRAILRGG
jgi:nucleoside-diphosphate-sugar epimerase